MCTGWVAVAKKIKCSYVPETRQHSTGKKVTQSFHKKITIRVITIQNIKVLNICSSNNVTMKLQSSSTTVESTGSVCALCSQASSTWSDLSHVTGPFSQVSPCMGHWHLSMNTKEHQLLIHQCWYHLEAKNLTVRSFGH